MNRGSASSLKCFARRRYFQQPSRQAASRRAQDLTCTWISGWRIGPRSPMYPMVKSTPSTSRLFLATVNPAAGARTCTYDSPNRPWCWYRFKPHAHASDRQYRQRVVEPANQRRPLSRRWCFQLDEPRGLARPANRRWHGDVTRQRKYKKMIFDIKINSVRGRSCTLFTRCDGAAAGGAADPDTARGTRFTCNTGRADRGSGA
jgi:hypothetical protein